VSWKRRVDAQPAWVLHTYPWKETSLIVELLTRDHGRVPVVAKGARRPLSALRGVLMGFQPLEVAWSGGGEVKTLVRAEWQGGQPLLYGRALLCGYYLNELVVNLSAREDPHSGLFAIYGETLAQLAKPQFLPPVLRRFELALLRELGYALMLDGDTGGAPIDPDTRYAYIIERGPVRSEHAQAEEGEQILLSGRTLKAMADNNFSDGVTLAESKLLLRTLIHHHLGGRPLQSRRVFKELQEL